MYSNVGKNMVKGYLGGTTGIGSPSYAALGSSSTASAVTDTALGSEWDRTRRTFDGRILTDKQVELEMILPSTAPSGLMPCNLTEVGIFAGSPTGSMFSRATFAPIEKNENVEFQSLITYRVI